MATAQSAGKSGSRYGDLKRRLVFLVLALVVFRLGTHIPVPGINPDALADLFRENQGGILGLFNMFSGGALRAILDFCFRYHALHFCIDHYAVDVCGGANT
jgi:preprotein translocase subunit SecY